MKSGYPKLLALCALFVSCNKKNEIDLTKLDPIVISNSGTEIMQYWEFNNEEDLWNKHPEELPEIGLYKDSLVQNLGYEKYKDAVQREGKIDAHYSESLNVLNGDQKNSDLVHTGSFGTLREINFLEAQLLNYQLGRYPLFSHPTEFVAYIVINDTENMVRVYFCSSDKPWPPKHHIVFSSIEKDLTQGWKLKYALHNHYEPGNNNYVGILAPSMTDVQMFKMLNEDYKLEAALITNGFNTVVIENAEFEEFESY
jgi:hypothetical protein